MIEDNLHDSQQAIAREESKNDLEEAALRAPHLHYTLVSQPVAGTKQFNENPPYEIGYSSLPLRTKLEIKILRAIGNATSFLYNLFSD